MNYEANTRRWQTGDVVIHDADAKRADMLMVVLGYHAKTGECSTRYLHHEYLLGMKKPYSNNVKFLHDPKRFGLQGGGA